MRAFLSIDVNSKEAIESISEAQRRLLDAGADLKLVDAKGLHFTVKFLGEISEAQAGEIHERLRALEFPSPEVLYFKLGVFPNTYRPTVIWVGVDMEGAERLKAIAGKVWERIRGMRLGDDRPFQAHITISRVRSGRNRENLLEVIKAYEGYAFGRDRLSSLKLKKSELTPRGPIYTDIYTFPFKEA